MAATSRCFESYRDQASTGILVRLRREKWVALHATVFSAAPKRPNAIAGGEIDYLYTDYDSVSYRMAIGGGAPGGSVLNIDTDPSQSTVQAGITFHF